MSAPEPTRRRLLWLAELSLMAVSVIAVLGLRRLFADGSFFPNVAFSAVAAHAVAIGCRRRRWPSWLAGLAVLGAAVVVVTWTQLPETTAFGLPTATTLTVAGTELHEAWAAFGHVVAPAPVLPGFVLAASIGAWIIAFAADSAAFRANATIEAVVPAGTLFVFGGALGSGEHRLAVAILFLVAVLVHGLARRALEAATSPTWLSSRPQSAGGVRRLLRGGAALVGVAVLASLVIGPNLPGADARAVIPWRATDRDGPDSRVTISPLVDIRSRLVDQADVEVFRVKASQRSYWRLTSLERFDGRIWSSNRQYRRARGVLGTDVDTTLAGGVRSTQTFTIDALASIWLPAGFRPVRLRGISAGYDGDSNSLLTEAETATGLTYTVESVLPHFSAARLRAVPAVAPRSVAEEYTALPPGFSVRVQQLAAQITRGETTQYAKAKALQDFFRSGAFTYDLNVPPGHSGNDLEDFLFVSRRGYCEQFSGAYAAMARAVGLPSRVAVGFTPGDVDPATGEYVVHGFNGHAWPEVYLDGFGWVAFEPTPGRGMPGAEAWTGVPEAQAQEGNPSAATTLPSVTPTTAPDGATATTAAPRPTREDPAIGGDSGGSPWPGLWWALALLVGSPLAWGGALALARAVRRRRRRAAAASPGDRVLVAWDEVTEALARAGTPAEPWETADEFARRATGATGVPGVPGVDGTLLVGLAGLTTTVTYGRRDVDEAAAGQAADVADRLARAADATVGRGRRVRQLLDPRPLLPATGDRVEIGDHV